MSIITKKTKNYNKNFEELNTLLTININGDGSEIFDYNLPTPTLYQRYNEKTYTLQYALKGVFWTTKGNDFLNDILLRFNISMNVKNIETRTIGNQKDLHELKSFSSSTNLDSLRKKIFIPASNKYEDNVFWALKLFTEYYIQQDSFLPYSTLENYAFNHYVDLAKDKSTLRAKCRSIWNYYEAREWQPQIIYIKKDKGEVMATRLEHIENMAKDKIEKNESIIKNAIVFLTGKSEKINITNIAKFTKLHRTTVSRYKHLWK